MTTIDNEFMLLLRSKTHLGRLAESEARHVVEFMQSIGFRQQEEQSAPTVDAVVEVPASAELEPASETTRLEGDDPEAGASA